MRILAGTSRGVFLVGTGQAPRQVLEGRGVRELVRVGDRLLAGTAAGLYTSDDEGETWLIRGLASYEVWQVRPSSDGTLFAGTQPAGLFRSTDNGDSWKEMESFSNAPEAQTWCVPVKPKLPGRARALVVDKANADRLWVGVEVGGIMRTTDGGASWSLGLPGENPDLHMMCAHPEKNDVLFASTGYGRLDGVAEMVEGNAGVFRSDDGGQSWEYAWWGITPRYSRPMCIDPNTPYGLTVASAPTAFSSYKDDGGAQAMLFRSEDGGESWRSLCDAAHTPSAANFHGLSPHPERPGAVFVGTDTGEVWDVSDDATWSPIADGLPPVLSVLGFT